MFDQIQIDDKNKRILTKAIQNKRINHCYIFIGPEGTEKRYTALEFIKAILCSGDDKPCNRCISCNKINNGNHPDFIDVYPQDNSIKINQLREIQRKMSIKAYESHYKIFLINGGETMGIAAQNSLLKSLEEPNHGVVVILLSRSTQSVLPTILSRGQILHFNPFDENTFQYYIKKQYNIDKESMEDLYNLSQGCIGIAKSMQDNPTKMKEFVEFRSLISTIIRGDYHRIFQFSKWVKDSNLSNESVGNYLLLIFRNILYDKLHNKVSKYKEMSDSLTYGSIHDIIQEIIELQSTLKYNVNFQLQIEKLLLKLQEEK